MNILPLRLLSKSMTEVPYNIGKSIMKVSEKSNKYIDEIFKMLDEYDKESLIFLDFLDPQLQKTLFFTMNSFDTTINVLLKNYGKILFINLFELSYEYFTNNLRQSIGLIFESKELSFVATSVDNSSSSLIERRLI